MAFWKRLAAGVRGALQAVERQQSAADPPKIIGRGQFSLEVVGESHYREALATLLGKQANTRNILQCVALLKLDDASRFDPNAVAVYIGRQQVGHLSRADAPAYRRWLRNKNLTHHRAMLADAHVYGGDERGLFSVRLDVPL
jgi:hypothetical protein